MAVLEIYALVFIEVFFIHYWVQVDQVVLLGVVPIRAVPVVEVAAAAAQVLFFFPRTALSFVALSKLDALLGAGGRSVDLQQFASFRFEKASFKNITSCQLKNCRVL